MNSLCQSKHIEDQTNVPLKSCVLIFLFLCLASLTYAQPAIQSFAPTMGAIGSQVTISGSGFSDTLTENTVYFGAVKAEVKSATPNSLQVIVPIGATYLPISITNKGLTAFSNKSFLVTFSGAPAVFTYESFSSEKTFLTGESPVAIKNGDLDGDGLVDAAVAVRYTGYVSIYRNTSTKGIVSFAPKIDITTNLNCIAVDLADFDGDGKLDVLVSNFFNFYILYNQSTPGNLVFTRLQPGAQIDGNYPPTQVSDIVAGDFNGDGKVDVATIGDGLLTVYRNTSSYGIISFMHGNQFPFDGGGSQMAIDDLDGDGKTDVAITTGAMISIIKNECTKDSLIFKSQSTFPVNYPTADVSIADLDGDGRKDLIVPNSGGTEPYRTVIALLRNTSINGTISFDNHIDFPTITTPKSVKAGDMDGDGRPDIVELWDGGLRIMKNKSGVGSFSFADDSTNYETAGYRASDVAISDIDGDGKTDMTEVNDNGWQNSRLSVFRNIEGEPKVVASGSNPVSGDIIATVYIDSSVQSYNGSAYAQRHFDIEPVVLPSTSTATVTLYASQKDFDKYNGTAGHGQDLPKNPDDATGKASLRIYQYHGTSASGLPGTYSGDQVVVNPANNKIVWNPKTQFWEITFDVSGFSGFFIASAGNVLPITLISFTGAPYGLMAQLNWTATNEAVNQAFIVQRSNDGKDFTTIGNVTINTANTSQAYSFIDSTANSKTYYYRLLLPDNYNAEFFSSIIKVQFDSNKGMFTAAPNPAHSYVTINHPVAVGDTPLQLFTMQGQKVKEQIVRKGSTQTAVYVHGFASGTYLIIWNNNGKNFLQKVVVN